MVRNQPRKMSIEQLTRPVEAVNIYHKVSIAIVKQDRTGQAQQERVSTHHK